MLVASVFVFVASFISVFYPLDLPELVYYSLPVWFGLIFFKHKILRLVALFLFVFFWTHWFIHQQQRSQLDLSQKTTITLQLEIIELPHYKTNSISFIAKPIKIIKAPETFDWLRLNRIKLSWYYPIYTLKAGQIWQMQVKIQPPHGYQNGAGFDYERWLFANRISATGYVVDNASLKLQGVASHHFILLIRSWLLEKITHYSDTFSSSGLFRALALGDRSALDPELKKQFSMTGTAHLLVISGLHVGLLSGFFFVFARIYWKLLNRYHKTTLNQQDFAIIWAWLAALIYAGLAGFSLPTLRALIMLSVLYIALLKRMNISFLNVFSVALIVVLIVQPLSMLSYSFWLSFIAVFIIVLSQYVLNTQSKIKSLLILQFFFSALFIPLNAVVFKQVMVTSFFANLLLIPVMSFVLIPLNLLVTGLAALDWSGVTALYQMLDTLMSYLQHYLQFLTQVFGESIPLKQYSAWSMLLSFIGLSLLLLVAKKPIIVPTLVIMFIPWLDAPKGLQQTQVEVVFFDVGMGTAVLINTQNHHLLYDLGPGNNKRYQPAKWVIAPYLQAKSIRHVDKIVLSHSDQDHYGGFWALKQYIKPEVQLLSGTPKNMQALLGDQYHFSNCNAYHDWVWDGVRFQFLAADEGLKSDNNRSCVLKISTPQQSVLLTADIEEEREQALIQSYAEELQATVLLVPHHGSETSSSNEFIASVNPQLAIVTAGYLNHWGFPRMSRIERYENRGVKWLNTASVGLISIIFKDNDLQLNTFRRQHQENWY